MNTGSGVLTLSELQIRLVSSIYQQSIWVIMKLYVEFWKKKAKDGRPNVDKKLKESNTTNLSSLSRHYAVKDKQQQQLLSIVSAITLMQNLGIAQLVPRQLATKQGN